MPLSQTDQSRQDSLSLVHSLIVHAKQSGENITPEDEKRITEIYEQFHDLNTGPEDLRIIIDQLESFGPNDLCGSCRCAGRDCSKCKIIRRTVYDLTNKKSKLVTSKA